MKIGIGLPLNCYQYNINNLLVKVNNKSLINKISWLCFLCGYVFEER